MDFIERWFGVWPDGGDGSLEWLLVVLALVAAAAVVFRRQLGQLFSTSDRQTRTNPRH